MLGKTLPRFVFAMALALLAVSCGGNDRKSSGSGYDETRNGTYPNGKSVTTVEMTAEHQFKPREITVDAGEMVTWKNTSKDVHTVSAETDLPAGAQPFHSGDVAPGKSWSHTFSTSGTFSYVCRYHREHGMTGRVTVRPPVK
jgi:plastocyanin